MKTDLSEPILPEFVAHAEAIAHQARSLEELIINRINYIVETLFKTFGVNLDFWYFCGAGEGEVGDLWRNYDKENGINIETGLSRNTSYTEIIIIDKNGDEWEFDSYIPIRWLFENFEQELIDGKKKYEEAQEAKKAAEHIKREAKKEKDKQTKALAAQAKKKLTKKELIALKQIL